MAPPAGIRDVRRLTLRSLAGRRVDDLRPVREFSVSTEVATLAVRRLRRRGWSMLLTGLILLAGFTAGVTALGDHPGWLELSMTIAAPAGLLLLPSGVVGVTRWSSRVRLVSAEGWRRGRAELHDPRRGAIPLTVWLADRGGVVVLSAVTTRPVVALSWGMTRSPVLVGGTGRRLVIVFRVGPFVVAAKRTGTHGF